MPTGEWKPCSEECPQCGAEFTEESCWESLDGAFEDWHHHCRVCDFYWWVDGVDS